MANQEREKKNKRKGMLFAFFFAASIVAFAIFPFTQLIYPETTPEIELTDLEEPEKVFTELPTEFEITDSEENRSSRPEPKPKDTPDPQPDPEPEPEPKEVVTDDNIQEEPVPQPDQPNHNENINPAPPEPSPNPNPNSNSGSQTNGNGNSNNPSNGNGDIWSDDNGKGKFTRKVIQRDERIKKLIKQRGTIVVRVAVDRDGRVKASEYQKGLSSIKHDRMGRVAEYYAKNYRFERDYKVAKTQYCNLTFIFELDD